MLCLHGISPLLLSKFEFPSFCCCYLFRRFPCGERSTFFMLVRQNVTHLCEPNVKTVSVAEINCDWLHLFTCNQFWRDYFYFHSFIHSFVQCTNFVNRLYSDFLLLTNDLYIYYNVHSFDVGWGINKWKHTRREKKTVGKKWWKKWKKIVFTCFRLTRAFIQFRWNEIKFEIEKETKIQIDNNNDRATTRNAWYINIFESKMLSIHNKWIQVKNTRDDVSNH